jgi:hypothetical protein
MRLYYSEDIMVLADSTEEAAKLIVNYYLKAQEINYYELQIRVLSENLVSFVYWEKEDGVESRERDRLEIFNIELSTLKDIAFTWPDLDNIKEKVNYLEGL